MGEGFKDFNAALSALSALSDWRSEHAVCAACAAQTSERTDFSFRGSSVPVGKMCDIHWGGYQRLRKSGALFRPMGEFDLI